MTAKLYGVGVGPGDPDLLTIKAKTIINSCDVLFCPKKSDDADSFALNIVSPHLDNKMLKIVELVFPMRYEQATIEQKWRDNAAIVSEHLKQGLNCAFITLGDPTVYSTFIYLLPYLKHVIYQLEIVPGITSFCAAAATIKQPLVAWQENLKIVPVRKSDSEALYRQIADSDNLVLMKPSNDAATICRAIDALKLHHSFALLTKVGTPEQQIIYDFEQLKIMQIPYLSTIIIKRGGWHD